MGQFVINHSDSGIIGVIMSRCDACYAIVQKSSDGTFGSIFGVGRTVSRALMTASYNTGTDMASLTKFPFNENNGSLQLVRCTERLYHKVINSAYGGDTDYDEVSDDFLDIA